MKTSPKISRLALVLLRIATQLDANQRRASLATSLLSFVNARADEGAQSEMTEVELLAHVAYVLNFERIGFQRAGRRSDMARRNDQLGLFLGAVESECGDKVLAEVRESFAQAREDHDALTDAEATERVAELPAAR